MAGEADAVKISEVLPFVEFDMQRQIMLKLKVLGMNAAFGMKSKLQFGNGIVIVTTSCTAVYLNALPPPPALSIARALKDGKVDQDSRLQLLQRDIEIMCSSNRRHLEMSETNRLKSLQNPTSRRRGSGDIKTDGISSAIHRVTSTTRTRGSAAAAVATGEEDVADLGEDKSDNENEDDDESSSESSSSSSSSENDDSSLESPSVSSDSSDESEVESTTDNKSIVEDVSSLQQQHGANFVDNDTVDAAVLVPRSDVTEIKDSTKSRTSRRSSISNSNAAGNTIVGASGENGVGNASARQRYSLRGVVASRPVEKIKKKKHIFRDDRLPFLLELDDETDADVTAMLNDWESPMGIDMTTMTFVPGATDIPVAGGRRITLLQRGKIGGLVTPSPQQRRVQKPSGKTSSLLSSASTNYLDGGVDGSCTPSEQLTKLFISVYMRLCYSVRSLMPCQIVCLTSDVHVVEEDTVEIIVNAVVHRVSTANSRRMSIGSVSSNDPSSPTPTPKGDRSKESFRDTAESSIGDKFVLLPPPSTASNTSSLVGSILQPPRPMGPSTSDKLPAVNSSLLFNSVRRADSSNDDDTNNIATTTSQMPVSRQSSATYSSSEFDYQQHNNAASGDMDGVTQDNGNGSLSTSAKRALYTTIRKQSVSSVAPQHQTSSLSTLAKMQALAQTSSLPVILTALPIVPGATVKAYLGPVQLHFIKEPWHAAGIASSTRTEEGGLDSFYYQFLCEVNAIARAHVAALGGNALLCHRVVVQEAGGRMYRNQSYNLISVTGDAACVEMGNNGSGGRSSGSSSGGGVGFGVEGISGIESGSGLGLGLGMDPSGSVDFGAYTFDGYNSGNIPAIFREQQQQQQQQQTPVRDAYRVRSGSDSAKIDPLNGWYGT